MGPVKSWRPLDCKTCKQNLHTGWDFVIDIVINQLYISNEKQYEMRINDLSIYLSICLSIYASICCFLCTSAIRCISNFISNINKKDRIFVDFWIIESISWWSFIKLQMTISGCQALISAAKCNFSFYASSERKT